ncbi:hypothetical protein D3C78_1463330 [compost metagenome]
MRGAVAPGLRLAAVDGGGRAGHLQIERADIGRARRQRHFGGGRDFAGLFRRDAFARELHGGIADGVEQRHRIDLPFPISGLVRHT